MSSAQDHKRIFDGDRGPNTGGMGAFAPSPLLTPALERRVIDQVVSPVIDGMRAEGTPFAGFLYVGLMLTPQGPKVIEFNVRFGDPEAQVVLPMLDGGLADLLMAAATGASMASAPASATSRTWAWWWPRAATPTRPESGKAVLGLDAAGSVPGALVFHAGTADHARRRRDGRWPRAHGGRARAVVSGRHRDGLPGRQPRALRRHAVPDRHRPQGDPVKYAVVTFGCRVNQADSLEIEGALLCARRRLRARGGGRLVIVNTCSVTASADQGARQTIRKVARENPGARIVVTGCYATRQPDELCGAARCGAGGAEPRQGPHRPVARVPGAWSLEPGAREHHVGSICRAR